MKELCRFGLAASSGNKDLSGFFPGRVVKIDGIFRGLMDTIGFVYRVPSLSCKVFQTDPSDNTDTAIIQAAGIDCVIDANKTCAALAYLGSNEGGGILTYQPEAYLILGYTAHWVYYVECSEYREIHYHARKRDRWETKTPLVLVMKEVGIG